jgi:hypothetical protein
MRVIRSAGQNVSPSDDGRLFDQIFTDGLFEETTITHLGTNNVALGAMYGIICGRDFTAEAQTVAVELPEDDAGTTGYIYVEIDTSSDDVITIGTALAPFTPTYEDLNTNGAVAQMIIAEYVASSVAITSLTPVYVMATSGSVLPGSVATVEVSPAVANHSVGDFILYGGQLYSVTAAISVGESLTPGTNISATSAGSELSSLKSDLTNVQNSEFVGYTVGTYTTRANTGRLITNRALKMVEFNLNNIITGAALTVGNTYALGSVIYHPYANIYANVNRQNGGNAVATLRLKTDGTLELMPLMSIPNGVGLYAHFTYFYQ